MKMHPTQPGSAIIAGVMMAALFSVAAYSQNAQSELSAKVGIDQKLEAQAPLNLTFRNETGQPVAARQIFRHEAGDPGARLLRMP